MNGDQQMALSLSKWDCKERARGCTEALLAGLRLKRQPMTAAQLAALTGEPARTVSAMLKHHVATGEVVRGGTSRAATYAVAGVPA